MLQLQCWCLLQVEVETPAAPARAKSGLKQVVCANLSPFVDGFESVCFGSSCRQSSHHGRPQAQAVTPVLEQSWKGL
jgi:hypothetical protein